MARPEIDRRRFLAAVAGTTMAVTAAGLAAPAAANAAKGMLVPPGKIGIQLFTIRNLVSSLGFRAVFEELARLGYQNVEFAGYSSPAEPGITVQQIKQLLDDNGLTGIGSHVGLNAFRTNIELELDRAEILGLPFIGTANEPVTAANRTVAGYRAAAAEFNAFGAAAQARGLCWYQHNHQNEFRFANDDPSVRLYDLLLAETDPKLVFLEMDIYWAYVGQHIAPGFDPIAYVIANRLRYPLFHAKDGRRSTAANGYDIVEFGAGDIDFQRFYTSIGSRGRHYSLYEQDNAPNTSPDVGGALGAAERSFDAIYELRG
ncbi:sugar phosphate isomerase/epimerase family protein [Jiangella alkaliphila]|uniref:Sugar phosphate isomerase/epimerase n=1 Tax=Jiangella alkaliphila TaxID=419479 RepID=A0A1H2JYK1_9ACTN|nr:sugar phosphate isomerase/epimerase [Jiangella alkaliphila]SDU61500.1 Sugar phosphate isomerase/epimerase [Jiangella alkaliphila]